MRLHNQINPRRIEWAMKYPGVTDNGVKLPIELVIPGAIIHGSPVGYWPAESEKQAEDVWCGREIKPSPETVVNHDYVPAPFRCLRGMLWNGQWYEWLETDPNAPMVPPEFRETV